MVRIKERYLLVNILYPRDGASASNNNNNAAADGKPPIPDFVAVRHATHSDLTPQLLLRAIKAETLALFGDCGAGGVERTLSVKYFNRATSTFILRITRDHLRLVWTALTFMTSVPVRNNNNNNGNATGPPCIFRVARVSGTIRKVEEEAIRQARVLILATKEHMAGNTTSAVELLTRARAGAGTAVVVSDDEGVDGKGDDNDETDDDDDFVFDDADGVDDAPVETV